MRKLIHPPRLAQVATSGQTAALKLCIYRVPGHTKYRTAHTTHKIETLLGEPFVMSFASILNLTHRSTLPARAGSWLRVLRQQTRMYEGAR